MSSSEKLTGKNVATELNMAHSPAELNKAFIDSIALKNGSTQSKWKEALATINAGVEMKRLGLDNFTIIGVGTDNGGHNILAVASKDGKEERLIGPDGEQYKFSADGETIADLKKNVLTDSSSVREPAAAADVAPKTVAFGNRNRQMTINADGSDAVYAVKKGDNLWSVAKDYLQQQGKNGSDRDVANLVKTIARDNKIQNANHLDINEQIHLKPIKAAETPVPKVTAPPEVAPCPSDQTRGSGRNVNLIS